MDSLSQLVLGSAVAIGVMGRRSSVWKAAAWGAVCGTLPDLDAFIDHGDAVSNMTMHRAQSHSLLYLTLLAPALAWLITRLHGEHDRFGRWWLAAWLALVTHPLLDTMTVYGTQLLLPFTDRPFGVGSIFIIDPLYTLPLLGGVVAALVLRDARGRRWNVTGLAASSLYLAWGAAAQQHVTSIATAALRAQGLQAQRLLVTPTAFNTVVWRLVVVTPDGYHEGFHSLLDRGRDIAFDRFARGEALYEALHEHPPVQRMAWFSRGFFAMRQDGTRLLIDDLRMGQEPAYTFSFVVAERDGELVVPVAPLLQRRRIDFDRGMRWLWQRAQGEAVAPPR